MLDVEIFIGKVISARKSQLVVILSVSFVHRSVFLIRERWHPLDEIETERKEYTEKRIG